MEKGRFSHYNHVLPSVYQNYGAVKQKETIAGVQGIVALATPLNWGAKVTKIKTAELNSSKAERVLGDVSNIMPIQEAGIFANELVIYRADSGGKKAKLLVEGLGTFEAKYEGVGGNDIHIAIENLEGVESIYRVSTYYKNSKVDSQDVKDPMDIKGNDYVTFEPAVETPALKEAELGALVGGENGEVEKDNANFIEAIKNEKFNVVVLAGENAGADAERVIQTMVYNKGIGVMVVTQDIEANNPYITQTANQGYVKTVYGQEIEVPANMFIYTVGGILAGTPYQNSATFLNIPNCTEVINELDDEELEDAVLTGHFVIAKQLDDRVKVVLDINSLHLGVDLTDQQVKLLKDNKTIRCMNHLRKFISLLGIKSFIGKTTANDLYAEQFQVAIGEELRKMETEGALVNVDKQEDIVVIAEPENKLFKSYVQFTIDKTLEKIYFHGTIK